MDPRGVGRRAAVNGGHKDDAAAMRWKTAVWIALRIAFGALLVVVMVEAVVSAMLPNIGDHEVYISAAQRWLAGGSFYPTYQLDGPYVIAGTEILYPPLILPLLVVFSFLPAILWWAVPVAILAGVLAYWRPSQLGWTLILICLANPMTFTIYLWGNPAMWFVALVALGTIYGWPAVLVAIKPTLAPFALIGVRRRSWWIAAGVLAAVALVFLPLWRDYAAVVANARGPVVSPLYSWQQVPLMLTPLIARWASTRQPMMPTDIS